MSGRIRLSTILSYVILVLFGVLMIYPFIWMVFACFKSNAEIFGSTKLLPSHFSFQAFVSGWKGAGQYTFADFFKQRNMQTDMFTRLYGHSLNRLAAKQYGGDFPPEVLYREVIEKLDYGVDFAKLIFKEKSNGTD